MIVYVSIGNSDDKLTQREWADFAGGVDAVLTAYGHPYGVWFSAPDSPWQNACWCVEFGATPVNTAEAVIRQVKARLCELAAVHRQDSIAWAVAETEFLRGPEADTGVRA